jgi:hypothetical protein
MIGKPIRATKQLLSGKGDGLKEKGQSRQGRSSRVSWDKKIIFLNPLKDYFC